MVTFSHLDRGTAEQLWDSSPRLQSVPAVNLDLAHYDRLVLVTAHPDDETLAAAGPLQAAALHGTDIRLVLATWGEASHPGSRTHTAERLAVVRRSELAHALDVLAPAARMDYVGLRDGEVADGEAVLRQAILAQCSPEPGRTLVVAPWRGDGHTDHAAAGRAAASAAAERGNRFLEYPVWLWHWANPEHPAVPWAAMRRRQLSAVELARKNTALACHHSQIEALSPLPGDETLLSAAVLSHFSRPFEIFIDAAGTMGPDGDRRTEWARHQFDAIHQGSAEPWSAADSWYEARKRQLTLAVLPRAHFSSGLELGCSTGVLTRDLASRCATLLGLDFSAEAVKTATERTAGLPGVEIRQLAVPQQWPEGTFDLIVLSEVGYYLEPAALRETIGLMAGSLTPDGVLITCHWRHPIEGWPLDGDGVHSLLRNAGDFTCTGVYTEQDFILETFALASAATTPVVNPATRDEPSAAATP